MAHNNPTKPPNDEQKIDWFMDTVTEKTYDSVHSTCTDKLLEGDLTFAKMLNYTPIAVSSDTLTSKWRILTRMKRKPSPTTPPPSDDHAIKAQKAKAVVLSGVAVVAREPLALIPLTPRLTHVTIVPKVKVKTARAKAKITHHAPLALANPNLTLVLTVVAGLTTLAIASNALLMKTKQIHQSNKPIKTS
jgi:hypothetical protein